jgi:hypothetical protein
MSIVDYAGLKSLPIHRNEERSPRSRLCCSPFCAFLFQKPISIAEGVQFCSISRFFQEVHR